MKSSYEYGLPCNEDAACGRKSLYLIVSVQILLILLSVLLLVVDASFLKASEGGVLFAARYAVFAICSSLLLWIAATKALFTPYTVLYLVMVLFFSGQCFGWAFGIDLNDKDLLIHAVNANTGTIPIQSLIDAEVYTCLGLQLFQLGALLSRLRSPLREARRKGAKSLEKDKKAFALLGKWLAIISVPSYIAHTYLLLQSVASGGYLAYYGFEDSMSQLTRLLLFPSNWFEPALLIVYVCFKDRKGVRRLAASALFATVFVDLYVGGRSSAVILLLAFLLAHHYFVKPFSLKNAIGLFAGGYVFVTLLNVIQNTRIMAGRGFLDYLSGIPAALASTVGDFLAEMGWSMSSLAWTMSLIPGIGDFRYGATYCLAVLGVIPNLGFWEVHPAVGANLGSWLQEALGASYGVGYTMIAETYANFGWAGLLAMLVIGYICAQLLAFSRKEADSRFKFALLVIIAMSTILKAFVRSSFSAIFRDLVFVVLFIAFAQYLVKRKEDDREEWRGPFRYRPKSD